MKKNFLSAMLFALLFSQAAMAQNKWLSMDDAILKVKTTLAPKNHKQLNWIPNSQEFYYISDDGKFVLNNAKSNTNKEIDLLKKINAHLKKQNADTLNSFPSIEFISNNIFHFETKYKQIAFYFIAEDRIELRNAENNSQDNIDYANNAEYIAYTQKNNLYLLTALKKQDSFEVGEKWVASGVVTQLTNDANENILNGSEKVHRNEFGITKGTFWSPKNSKLAFYKMDQSMVNDYPIIDWNETPAKNKNIKYPMSGGASHQVALLVYDIKSKKTITVQTGKPLDQYLTNICWSPDETHIFIAIVNRAQNHLWLNSYNANTGVFERTVLEETDDKYVEPMNPMLFVKNSSLQFVWQSNRSGYNHLYLYDIYGNKLQQLTNGKFEVLKVHGFDKNAEKLFYTANAESPICKDFYSVDVSSARITKLSNGVGTHNVKLSDDGAYFIDCFNSVSVPNNITLCDAINGKNIQTILKADDPLLNYKLADMSIFKIRNEHNDELFCRIYKPVDFDSTKKYPAIVYLYNGPHVQLVTNSWLGGASNLWFQYMAQHGFVVFTIDGRGSDNRGKDFEQIIHRQLGVAEMEDQLEGIDYLKSKSWVDASRIGIHGWSFGGFMTTNLFTKYPDVFKVGVAGGPVIDWSLYEIMYTERYMDTPMENPNGYQQNNLLNNIDNLKGKLMLLHGTNDDVVVWQHSLNYIKKCVDKGKQIDYFAYPGHLHNVLGKDRVHLYQKITDYFIQNL